MQKLANDELIETWYGQNTSVHPVDALSTIGTVIDSHIYIVRQSTPCTEQGCLTVHGLYMMTTHFNKQMRPSQDDVPHNHTIVHKGGA